MIPYDELYKILFRGITDAIGSIKHQEYSKALYVLIKAQQDAEEAYIQTVNCGCMRQFALLVRYSRRVDFVYSFCARGIPQADARFGLQTLHWSLCCLWHRPQPHWDYAFDGPQA